MTSWLAEEIRAVPLRLPVAGVLGLTVAFATVLHATLALRSPAPWIVPDELIYSELAKSLAAGGLPAIRDEVTFAYGVGYPLLLAPVWAVFDDVTRAYEVAKVLNALVLSLTAVPAYLLARRFLEPRQSLLVAVLAVSVPSMLYAGTLMTEVALYPAFVLALLAIAVALERPSAATQAAALGAIALTTSIKVLGAVLVLAYVAGIALFHLLETRGDRAWLLRMRGYSLTWVALAVAVVGGLAISLVRGQDVLLGAYSVVLGNADLLDVPWWALLHLAELDLYLAVVPFAATLAVLWRGAGASAEPRERLLFALVVPTTLVLLAVVAAFASTPFPGADDYPQNVARLHERSTFVLAPLFLVGMVLALTTSRTSRRVLLVTGLSAATLPAIIPLDQLSENAAFQALALVPWIEAGDAALWPLGCLGVTLLLAALYVGRARAFVLVAAVLALFVVSAASAQRKMEWSSEWTKTRAWGVTPDWIDRASGGEPVTVLWAETGTGNFVEQAPRHRVLWLGEFFNRSVGPVYELGTSMPYGLPSKAVRLDGDHVVFRNGDPLLVRGLVLVPCHVTVDGTAVARDWSTGAVVSRVTGELRPSVGLPDDCAQAPTS